MYWFNFVSLTSCVRWTYPLSSPHLHTQWKTVGDGWCQLSVAGASKGETLLLEDWRYTAWLYQVLRWMNNNKKYTMVSYWFFKNKCLKKFTEWFTVESSMVNISLISLSWLIQCISQDSRERTVRVCVKEMYLICMDGRGSVVACFFILTFLALSSLFFWGVCHPAPK